MLLKELINKGIETISVLYPDREAREMVMLYLEDCHGIRRLTHILEPEAVVSAYVTEESFAAFARMASGEPIQYMIGKAHFYGREFNVSPSVLIPRPETEVLCREVVMHCHKGSQPRVLDMCTGSGCIAWTLAMEIVGADVTAVDISDGALEVARSQDFSEEIACSHARAPRFMKADVLGDIPAELEPSTFDVIVSNPPYVMDSEKAMMRSNVLEHEPHLALFVPDDDPLLFYRAVARWAAGLLAPGGFGVVEINEALGPQTAKVFSEAGFAKAEIVCDLSDRHRFVRFHR
jgi:release factor glutamine methyltransferase